MGSLSSSLWLYVMRKAFVEALYYLHAMLVAMHSGLLKEFTFNTSILTAK